MRSIFFVSALLAALTADQGCVVGLPAQRMDGDAPALIQMEAGNLAQVDADVHAEQLKSQRACYSMQEYI